MILLTGGAGFIGSQLLKKLNQEGFREILLVDNLSNSTKWKNLLGTQFKDYIHKEKFYECLKENKAPKDITAVFHLGACSSTTEYNVDYLMENNVAYSQKLYQLCSERKIPFLYASSASVYGDGSNGYLDDHKQHLSFRPLNAYGFSKHLFDSWVLKQKEEPSSWYGLRFFNVYGNGEEHKGFMQSVVSKARKEILETGKLKLFQSHRSDYKDGEQKRDFVYVNDVVNTLFELWRKGNKQETSGLYNVGSGKARSFYDLGASVFQNLGKEVKIEWTPMPEHLREQYQYFTEAPMEKLRALSFIDLSFHSLEEGIKDTLKQRLL